MLEKVGTLYFFPAILFNETFWQLEHEKRLAILNTNQVGWVGDHPSNRAYLFKDPNFLNVLKSIKLTYFSYSKIDLPALIDILTVKNSYAITDFKPFGDPQESPLIALNKIVKKYSSKNEPEEQPHASPTLAKITAAKYYSRFNKLKQVESLIVSPLSILDFWENFFKSLDLIDKNQNTKLLVSGIFYFAEQNESSKEILLQELEKYHFLKTLFQNKQLIIQTLILSELTVERKYDYIFINKALNTVPADILLKYSNTVFNVLGRVVYTQREDEIKAAEKTAKLASLETDTTITDEDIQSIDYEILFREYQNIKAINLLETNFNFRERLMLRFSVPLLSIFVKLVKSLKTNGILEVWDYTETRLSKNTLALMRKDNGEVYTLIDFDMYMSILRSFDDISIDYKTKTLFEVIAEEIPDTKHVFLSLEKIVSYMEVDHEFTRKFFDINNFTYKDEVGKLQNNLKAFEFLKKKKIYLLGIPTLLYKTGFKKFKNNVLKHSKLKDFVEKENFSNRNLKSYEHELVAALIPFTLNKAEKNKTISITRELSAPENAEFYKFLEEAGFDKERIMHVIQERWEELVQFSYFASNIMMLEVSQKN